MRNCGMDEQCLALTSRRSRPISREKETASSLSLSVKIKQVTIAIYNLRCQRNLLNIGLSWYIF